MECGIGYHGQVLFINDILGSSTDFTPQHTKQYTKLSDIVQNAITEYYEARKDEA
jgi:ketopantoate hydroxymethyltransferase